MRRNQTVKSAEDRAKVEQRMELFRQSLAEANVRLTAQRRAVFQEVARRLDHPDAEAVYLAVREAMPSVSRDTIHRALGLLKDLGLLVPLGPRHESVRYDAHIEPHDHYVCLQCGMTRDIEGPGVDLGPRIASTAHLGSAMRARVEVLGICRACAERLDRGEKRVHREE
jgi:Fe2+ or Zn2+ uptake regulation protein